MFHNLLSMITLMHWTFWEEIFSTLMSFSEERKFMFLEIGTFSSSLLPWVFLKVKRNNNFKRLLTSTFSSKKKIAKRQMIIQMKKIRKNQKLKLKILFLRESQFQDYSEICRCKKLRNKYLKGHIVNQSLCRLLLVSKKIIEVTKWMNKLRYFILEWLCKKNNKIKTHSLIVHQTLIHQMSKIQPVKNLKDKLNKNRRKLVDFKNMMV